MADDGGSLLDLLRDRLGLRSVKDGCSPQGQCGCCTVWIDGQPRVSCVTAARRAAGRQVTTLDGVPGDVRRRWAQAFADHGASQCGFCTPGILMRLIAALDPVVAGGEDGPARGARRPVPASGAAARAAGAADEAVIERALAAHLCRCTGWLPIADAARAAVAAAEAAPAPEARGAAAEAAPVPAAAADVRAAVPAPGTVGTAGGRRGPARAAVTGRDLAAAARRAEIEGATPQQVGLPVVLGRAGFADDTAPEGALVAVPDGHGGWTVADTLAEARARAGRTQGRNTTLPVRQPLAVPDGSWDLVLSTTFVEPAYLEPDASWCVPGGEPATPLANGGAFGGKLASAAPAAARELARRHGRAVRVVLGREDVVRTGPKRPPIAAGVSADGTGAVRVARTPGSELAGWAASLASVAPGLGVEVVDVPGPPVAATLRGAGWVEGAVLLAGLALRSGPRPPAGEAWPAARVRSPAGAVAEADVAADGTVSVTVCAGPVLDEVVLRSYCVGAVHQALGWVRTEGVAVDDDGSVRDLTIRSFGVLPARAMPPVAVTVLDGDGPPVPGGDAVFAAAATAAWAALDFAPRWPADRGAR